MAGHISEEGPVGTCTAAVPHAPVSAPVSVSATVSEQSVDGGDRRRVSSSDGRGSSQDEDEDEEDEDEDKSEYDGNGNGNGNDDDNDSGPWDSASLYEDILDEAEAFTYATTDDGSDTCTADEARQLRQRLHVVGASQFVLENITNKRMTARRMCSAFRVRIPAFLAGAPDDALYQLLGLAINRELNKRPRLSQYRSLDDAARLLRERSHIMVITGAGISTSLGIPDFRSKNTGFYARLLEMGYDEPEHVFDITAFDNDPRTFYALAGDIIPALDRWTPAHHFIRLLQDKGKLLTNYTQNIDNVEASAGIRKDKLIQCHGSWATATCRKCRHQLPGHAIFDAVRARTPAECPQCRADMAAAQTVKKRKRVTHGNAPIARKKRASDSDSDSDGAYDLPQPGIMKPDITFFGEQLPNHFFDRLRDVDKDLVDLVIVMGTSMKVAPVSEIPNFLPRHVPQIYISRDPIHHINFDINLLGDCDVIVAELARRAGWDLQHKMIPQGQTVETRLVDEAEHIISVKAKSGLQMTKNGATKEDPVTIL